MLARRFTTILPAMTLAEALETTRIHRIAGLTGDHTAWVATRPCRAPHHTISDAGLIGGGHVPMPGDVSLAHNGVLFLVELPEFRVPIAQAEAELQPDRMADDLCGKAVVLVVISRWCAHWTSMAHEAGAEQATQQVDNAAPRSPVTFKEGHADMYCGFRTRLRTGSLARTVSCWRALTARFRPPRLPPVPCRARVCLCAWPRPRRGQ
jgi:hypothetical protein